MIHSMLFHVYKGNGEINVERWVIQLKCSSLCMHAWKLQSTSSFSVESKCVCQSTAHVSLNVFESQLLFNRLPWNLVRISTLPLKVNCKWSITKGVTTALWCAELIHHPRKLFTCPVCQFKTELQQSLWPQHQPQLICAMRCRCCAAHQTILARETNRKQDKKKLLLH